MSRGVGLLAWLWTVTVTPHLAGCDADEPPPPVPPHASAFPPDPKIVSVAGTGAMVPLVTHLAEAWRRAHPNQPVVVEASIGSAGGVRAAVEGAVDLGLVSRPLTDEERRLGLRWLPLARDAVVVAAHPSVAADDVSSAELVRLYAGEATSFRDGTPATVFWRDRRDSTHTALERLVPELKVTQERWLPKGQFKVLYHDDAMGAALATTPGAIGSYSLGAITTEGLPLKVLAINGVRPSRKNLTDGSWPATRELALVFRPDRESRIRPFLEFLLGPEGQALMTACDYLPLGRRDSL